MESITLTDFRSKILQYNSEANLELLGRSYYYSKKSHKRQTRLSGEPFFVHCQETANILINLRMDIPTICAGLLHDVLEDTEYHYSEIKQRFGLPIAEIVFSITDELGRNRKERKEKTWPKLKMNGRAFVVKQADMIANARQGTFEKSDILNMYIKEYPKFKSYFNGLGMDVLWNELDKLLLKEKT